MSNGVNQGDAVLLGPFQVMVVQRGHLCVRWRVDLLKKNIKGKDTGAKSQGKPPLSTSLFLRALSPLTPPGSLLLKYLPFLLPQSILNLRMQLILLSCCNLTQSLLVTGHIRCNIHL